MSKHGALENNYQSRPGLHIRCVLASYRIDQDEAFTNDTILLINEWTNKEDDRDYYKNFSKNS